MDMYLRHYEVTCDHLYGPPLEQAYNCILSMKVIKSPSLLCHPLTGTEMGFP